MRLSCFLIVIFLACCGLTAKAQTFSKDLELIKASGDSIQQHPANILQRQFPAEKYYAESFFQFSHSICRHYSFPRCLLMSTDRLLRSGRIVYMLAPKIRKDQHGKIVDKNFVYNP